MKRSAKIIYRDFYDIPRIFIVEHEGTQFLFDCKFDDSLDDYPEVYQVFMMAPVLDSQLKGSWEDLKKNVEKSLGKVDIHEVKFDASKRKRIETTIIDDLMRNRSSS